MSWIACLNCGRRPLTIVIAAHNASPWTRGQRARVETESILTTPIELTSHPGPGLLFSLMLVAAIVGGYAARLMRD